MLSGPLTASATHGANADFAPGYEPDGHLAGVDYTFDVICDPDVGFFEVTVDFAIPFSDTSTCPVTEVVPITVTVDPSTAVGTYTITIVQAAPDESYLGEVTNEFRVVAPSPPTTSTSVAATTTTVGDVIPALGTTSDALVKAAAIVVALGVGFTGIASARRRRT